MFLSVFILFTADPLCKHCINPLSHSSLFHAQCIKEEQQQLSLSELCFWPAKQSGQLTSDVTGRRAWRHQPTRLPLLLYLISFCSILISFLFSVSRETLLQYEKLFVTKLTNKKTNLKINIKGNKTNNNTNIKRNVQFYIFYICF